MTLFLRAFGDLRHLPRAVWVTSAAALVNRLGTMALPFLALFLTKERALAPTTAGLFISLYGLTALVAAPTSGRLVDHFGPKRVMVGSFVATGLFVIAVPWAKSTLALALLIVAWALSNETFRPAVMAHLGGSVGPGMRKQAFALNRWAVNLGMSVGPAVGGLIATHSYRLLFFVDGASTLAAVAILALWLPATPPLPRTHEPTRSALPFGALGDVRLAAALLALLPLSALFFQMDSTVPLFVVDHLHRQPATFGLMVAVNTLLIVFVEIPLNHATAHWSHRRTMGLGALFAGLGFAAYALARDFPTLALATAIWTVGEMIASPGISAYVAEIAPAARRGEYMGLYMMTWSIAFIVAPWAGTQLLAHAGPVLLWPILGGLGLLSALGFSRLPQRPSVAEPPISNAPAEL